MIDPSIFKSYDVRGIYPSPLDEEAAYAIGRAFVAYTKAKSVFVGHDARLSSPALFKALANGLVDQGATVYFIGQVPTEMIYFAVASYDMDAGIMITASHNPKEYNGFKMMKKEGSDIAWIRGKDLLEVVQRGGFIEVGKGKVEEKDIMPDYVRHITAFAKDMKPLKVAVDASNGVIGKVIDAIEAVLPFKVHKINFEPNGDFPNHSPNPLEEGSTKQIKEAIKSKELDFGIMFDGDADRIFLVDEAGELISSDITRLLLAKYFLEKEPGAKIIHDLICSRAVPELIRKWGGTPIKAKVGFVNIREELIAQGAVMGGELSGHYCFRDYFSMDSGMMAFFILLNIISNDARKLSEIAKEWSPYAKAPVVSFPMKGSGEDILAKVKEKYADGKQDELDGLTVEYGDWWFNLRGSNTEPLIKLTIEADTQELLDKKKQEISALITG